MTSNFLMLYITWNNAPILKLATDYFSPNCSSSIYDYYTQLINEYICIFNEHLSLHTTSNCLMLFITWNNSPRLKLATDYFSPNCSSSIYDYYTQLINEYICIFNEHLSLHTLSNTWLKVMKLE